MTETTDTPLLAAQPNKEPTTDKIAAALAKAQGAFENPPKNRTVRVQMKTGGSYVFSYATLDAIIDSVRKPLSENGLAFIHQVSNEPQGRYRLITTLMHASGQSLTIEIPMMIAEQSNQAFGSALSYAKRYSLCALLGVAADEDDDGNAADGNSATPTPAKPSAPTAAPLPPPAPKADAPVHPETGEISPHEIPLHGKTKEDWRKWGQVLIAAFSSAKSVQELEDWALSNNARLAKLREINPTGADFVVAQFDRAKAHFLTVLSAV